MPSQIDHSSVSISASCYLNISCKNTQNQSIYIAVPQKEWSHLRPHKLQPMENFTQLYTEGLQHMKKVLLFVTSCQISWTGLEESRLSSWACDKPDSQRSVCYGNTDTIFKITAFLDIYGGEDRSTRCL